MVWPPSLLRHGCSPTDVPPAGIFLWPRVAAPSRVPGSLCRAVRGQAPGQPAGPLWPPHESLHHVCSRDCPTYSRIPFPTPGAGPLTPDPDWPYCLNPNLNFSAVHITNWTWLLNLFLISSPIDIFISYCPTYLWKNLTSESSRLTLTLYKRLVSHIFFINLYLGSWP